MFVPYVIEINQLCWSDTLQLFYESIVFKTGRCVWF